MLEQYGKDIDLYQFVENSLNAVFIMGVNGIVYANQKCLDLLGIERKEELLGKSFYNYLHPDYHLSCIERVKRVVENGEIAGLEEQKYIKSDGTIVDVEVLATPFRMPNGEILAQGITNDITARKKVEKQVMDSEKLSLVGELAAGIVHEIRNPLTSIKGFLQLLKMESTNHHYIDIMENELGYIEKIASELLLLSKPEKETFTSECMIEILNNTVFLLKHHALKRGVNLVFEESQKEAIWVKGDRTKLKQAFINLIKNAIEASSRGGQVKVDINKRSNNVHINIMDDGCGIPKEKISKLGESFYTTKEEGTGLGLMITYHIIQRHKGNIDVFSEEGLGTTFTVSLPSDNNV